MKLREIDFGNVFTASGARGFFGEGYWHHKLFRLLFPGFNFSGSTFIAKTTTIPRRMPSLDEKGKGWGNLPLNQKTLQPIELFPDCIKVSILKGEALNAVSLTGLSAEEMFALGKWQKIQQPFGISFMALGKTREERLQETQDFFNIFKQHLPDFSAPVFGQINKSCPNTEHCPSTLTDDILGEMEIANKSGIPTGIKINVLTPIDPIKKVTDSGLCDFIEVPNTLPFGEMSHRIDWNKKYGRKSPLEKYGGGGYSGKENFFMALEWINLARAKGIRIPIVCGGVSCKSDVGLAKEFGASAVAFARITMTPFHAPKIKGIINHANSIRWR